MMKTFYKSKDAQWGPNACVHKPTFSWKNYQLITNKCLCYYQFVDGIFMMWTGSEKELKYFLTRVNSDHTKIKFECKYSNKENNFLDTIVCTTRSNTLITKLYKKETDRNAYLHYKSYHPSKLGKHSLQIFKNKENMLKR